jgi:small subunit ribosomal protein S6
VSSSGRERQTPPLSQERFPLLGNGYLGYLQWLTPPELPHLCVGSEHFPSSRFGNQRGAGYVQREDCQDMPRPYEAVYVFDSTLEDSAVNEKLDRFHQLLGTTGEMKVDHWGRRQLAYPIGPRENGYYVVARFEAETAGIPEYERALKLDEGVIRYLLTIFEHEVGAPPMTEEELALAKKRGEDDDEDEE